MGRDDAKTKGELIGELNALRRRVAALDRTEAGRSASEETAPGNEARYRIIVEEASEGIWAMDAGKRITFANRKMADLLGVAVRDLPGRSAIEFMFPEDLAGHEERMKERTLGKGGQYEQRLRRADGTALWCLISATALMDEAGRYQGSFAMVIDISARKGVEKALQESRNTLRVFLDAIPESAFLMDASGKVLAANATTARRLGRRLEKLIGTNIYESFDRAAAEHRKAQVKKAVQLRTPVVFGDERDGRVFSHYVFPVADPDGTVARLAVISMDVTDQVEAEETVRQVLDNTSEAVFLVDVLPNGRFRFDRFNRTEEEATGISSASAHGRSPEEILSPKVAAGVTANYRRCVEAGEPISYEEELDLPAGRRVWQTVLVPGRDAGGRVSRITGFGRDITDRKRAETELLRLYEQTQQDAETKSGLLKEVNHRVKNNLIAILGLLLAEKRHVPAEGIPFVTKTLDRIARHIEGLLEAHQMLSESQWAPMRLSDLAERTIGAALRSVPAFRRIEVDITPSSVKVSPRQASNLALVINELATNTRKHAAHGRKAFRIRFRVGMEGSLIRAEFRDDGPGYPEEVLKHEGFGTGMQLVNELVTGTLRGTLTLTNEGGAVAVLRVKPEEKHRT